MHALSRVGALAALSLTLLAPAASANGTMKVSLKPNKGGTILRAAPTSFNIAVTGLTTPSTTDGNTRLAGLRAALPEQLLFNSIGFKQCDKTQFIATKSCPSATKLGDAKVTVDAGEAGIVPATTELWFGTGFTVLARVQADKPAVIDEAVIGSIRSSGEAGYGLELYIPVPTRVSNPLGSIFPTVRALETTVTPPSRRVKVPGEKGRTEIPLTGLGPCSGALNFNVTAVYADLAGTERTESAPGKASCKK